MAYSKGSTEESLMKALIPEGCGGRVEYLRLAPAGSHYYLGLKGQGPQNLGELPLGQAVRHAVCVEELHSTWRREDKCPRGAGGRNGRCRKTKTVSLTFGWLPSPGMHWSKQACVAPRTHPALPTGVHRPGSDQEVCRKPTREPASLTLEMFYWGHKGLQ